MIGGVRVSLELLKRFRTTGAILPSSQRLANSMLSSLNVPGRKPFRILEVGAGTGAITKVISEQMIPGDFLDVIEFDEELARLLKSHLSQSDSLARHSDRIRVSQSDIRYFDSKNQYDLIICALPFNNFDIALTTEIFNKMFSLLSQDGKLLFFEYLGVRRVRRAWARITTKKRHLDVSTFLASLTDDFNLNTTVVMINLPPARVYELSFKK